MFPEHPQQQAGWVLAGNTPQRQGGLGARCPAGFCGEVCHKMLLWEELWHPQAGWSRAGLGAGTGWPHLASFEAVFVAVDGLWGCVTNSAAAAASVGHSSG